MPACIKDIFMKHIMMIANDTTFAYNLRRELLQHLVSQAEKVTLVAQELSFREEFEEMGVHVIPVVIQRRGTNIFADIKLFFAYFSVLRQYKPDVVLTNNVKPNIYGGLCCRILGIPYIPNITGLGTAVEYPGPLQLLTTFLYKIGVAGASSILFQNSENEEFFRDRKIMPKKARVVRLPGSGVNLEAHPVMPYPREEQKHFLFVARILREKGIDQYLGAARRIRQEHPNAVFHICGGCDDPAYTALIQQAQEAGDVVWHGQQKDMAPFFARACCLVHPSYYPEGMSNVLQEAAASGRPVIAADRSGCRETVDPGRSGYVIPIKDEDALVSVLEDFLAKTWEEQRDMGLAGRAKMEKEFDRAAVIRMVSEEIHRITAESV